MKRKNMSIEKPAIFIENMNGFSPAVRSLRQDPVYSVFEFIEGDLEGMLKSEDVFGHRLIGIVKGPRYILNTQTISAIAERGDHPVISYIGRHPSKVIDTASLQLGRDYDEDRFFMPPVLQFKVNEEIVPLVSIANSPLSVAVSAYVIGMSRAVLETNHELLSTADQLSIPGGNSFEKRLGHNFTERSISEADTFRGLRVGVVGAGDVGVRVIKLFDELGGEVFYTATAVKRADKDEVNALTRARYYPSVEALLRESNMDILTTHLPSGVRISLRDVDNLRLFVHTSSGSNIDIEELLLALDEGRIKQAIIDVFEFEDASFSRSHLNPSFAPEDRLEDTKRKQKLQQLIGEHRLFLTPHIAYNEQKELRRALKIAIGNILAHREVGKQDE